MNPLPSKDGVYQDQRGRGFVRRKGRWFRLVMSSEVDPESDETIDDLVPLGPMSGNVEPDFKPFRVRRPLDLEEP